MLLTCPECNKEVSSDKTECIHCGKNFENDMNISEQKEQNTFTSAFNRIIEIIGLGLLVLLCIIVLFAMMTPK